MPDTEGAPNDSGRASCGAAMKHLWTTAAVAAVLALVASGAQAAPEKKSQAEVAKSLRGADKKPAEKKAADKKAADKRKPAETTSAKAKKAADTTAKSKARKAAEAEVPTKGPVAKGPLKTEAPAPVTVGRG